MSEQHETLRQMIERKLGRPLTLADLAQAMATKCLECNINVGEFSGANWKVTVRIRKAKR